MTDMPDSPTIWLQRDAFRANMERAKEVCGSARLMLAVKSNAYGLGAEQIVPEAIAAGVDELAVLDIETALAIRPLAPTTPLLAWLLAPGNDFSAALDAGVELGISAAWQLEAIAECAARQVARVHLKIDTGLHRNGARKEDWPALVSLAARLEEAGVIQVRAVWSHLADTSRETSLEALDRLHEAALAVRAAGLQPELLHLAASHAAIELPETRLDMVRFGILAYGISPFADHSAEQWGFTPVMTLTAPVLDRGEHLVLGVGFGHGLIAPVTPGAEIEATGNRFRLTAMDVDHSVWTPLTGDSLPKVGDQVAVIGAAPGAMPIEAWAALCHTIGDEVIAHLDTTLERRWTSASVPPASQ